MPPSANKEFLTRFIASTKRRLERAQKVIDSPEHADGRALGMDIHLIWGEAAMLDLPQIAQLAREAEAAARRLGLKIRPKLGLPARRLFALCAKGWTMRRHAGPRKPG